MKHGLIICAAILAALSSTGSALAQFAPMAAGGSAAATEVGYVVLQSQSVPLTTTLPGRVAASASAEVRPQVGGIITAVNGRDGQPVKAGDLLFTIDDKNYQAQVAAAEASLASANAQLPSAESKVTRYEQLLGSGGVTATDLETAKVELAQAQAAVQSAEAQLSLQQITLEQTQVKAPITGILGTVNAQIGSLVTAGQADALATIRTIDPAYVELVESSANILTYRPKKTDGKLNTPPPAPTVNLTLEDGSLYDQQGTISSADPVVSETTGTVTLRATVPNPDMTLLPGMFVRTHVSLGQQENAFLVPQRAVSFDDRGDPTAYFVTADNKAEKRVLTATRDMNNAWVVTAGVTAGDKLIVDGLQKISDGSSIAPVEVTISDDGVVFQTLGTTTTTPAADVTTTTETAK